MSEARHLLFVTIFALAVLAAGAIGAGLELAGIGADPAGGLGMLVWLILPALTAALLFTLGRDWRAAGLAPRFAAGAGAWLWALAGPLLVAGVLMALARLSGAAVMAPVPAGALGAALAASLGATLVKNIFEEFAWRGFLTPRLAAAGLPDIAADLITGLIWWSWHLAYWFLFLSPALVVAETGLSPLGLTLTALVALPLQALFFGELRRASGSFWPAWLAHSLSNLATTALTAAGLAMTSPLAVLALSPGSWGLGYALLLAGLGLWLRARRLG